MRFIDFSKSRDIQFKYLNKRVFFIFAGSFLILMQLGSKYIESSFIKFRQITIV